MAIDTHAHIFDEQIYKEYFAKAGNKVDKVLTLHYFFYTAGNEKNRLHLSLDELLEFSDTKENLHVVASVDVNADILEQLKKLDELFKQKKIFGIKLYPGYQHFYASDEKIIPIAELCAKYNKPLIFHSGDVYDFEQQAILKYSHPIHIDGLANSVPDCTIVIAHFGFPYHFDTANIVSKNKNVYTEISGTITECDNDKEMANLVNQYATDLERVFNYFPEVREKTMFGTDFSGENTPLNEIHPYFKLVDKVFSKEERPRVLSELAKELFFN